MRKIIVSEFLSLDGVMEGPGPDDQFVKAGWTMPYMSDELGKLKFDELFASGGLLLGRVTYEGFAKFWPTAHDEFGDKMNSLPKYVVSTTLEETSWNNSQLIKEDVAQKITELKQEAGKDLLVNGSGELVKTLLQHDLVDEYKLMIFPVVLGTGKRLFKDGISASLELVAAESFKTGVVLLTYQSRKK